MAETWEGQGQFQTEHPVVQYTPPKFPEMHKLDFHVYGRRFNHEFAHMFGHVWWSTRRNRGHGSQVNYTVNMDNNLQFLSPQWLSNLLVSFWGL